MRKKKLIRKDEFIRVPYKIIDTVLAISQCLIVNWLPYLLNNWRAIRFFPRWLYSFRKGAAFYKNNLPMMNFKAVEWLDSYLTKDMRVFEYGSGGSTLFFAKRTKEIISIEHYLPWYNYISEKLRENNLTNCQLIFNKSEYHKEINKYPDNYFDLIVVDGKDRMLCFKQAINKVKDSGYILLDDSYRKSGTANANPEYKIAEEWLKTWPKKDFFGPKLNHTKFYQTSIWQNNN